jgi:aldose 1-epimerase
MFKIVKEAFGDFTKVIIENSETGEYIAIIPEFGGNVCAIVLNKEGKNYSILDGYKTSSEIVELQNFKSSKLLPFPNRIKDGKYSFKGRSYQLPINEPDENHAIHGLIWDKNLILTEKEINDKYASVKFEYLYNGIDPGYPFKIKVTVTYSLLSTNGFKYTTEIVNLDNCEIPVGDGWHPYFKTNGKVDNLMLKIPAKHKIEVDPRMIPTGVKLPADSFNQLTKIGDSELDTGFIIEAQKDVATTEIYDPDYDLHIKVWQEIGKWKYNYLQIYIPPSRESIAIEPMTCSIDAFNNKEGLIVLAPEQSVKATCGVKLE